MLAEAVVMDDRFMLPLTAAPRPKHVAVKPLQDDVLEDLHDHFKDGHLKDEELHIPELPEVQASARGLLPEREVVVVLDAGEEELRTQRIEQMLKSKQQQMQQRIATYSYTKQY